MIVHKNGDILSSTSDIICQQVNCRGIMGSGLAKQIREWFPEVYDGYIEYCKNKSPHDLLGCVNFVKINILNNNTKHIFANIFGQLNYGRHKVVYTDYIALEKGLKIVYGVAKIENLSVAIPYNIGCGLANGDWNIVSNMIEKIFSDDVVCEIWKL